MKTLDPYYRTSRLNSLESSDNFAWAFVCVKFCFHFVLSVALVLVLASLVKCNEM